MAVVLAAVAEVLAPGGALVASVLRGTPVPVGSEGLGATVAKCLDARPRRILAAVGVADRDAARVVAAPAVVLLGGGLEGAVADLQLVARGEVPVAEAADAQVPRPLGERVQRAGHGFGVGEAVMEAGVPGRDGEIAHAPWRFLVLASFLRRDDQGERLAVDEDATDVEATSEWRAGDSGDFGERGIH